MAVPAKGKSGGKMGKKVFKKPVKRFEKTKAPVTDSDPFVPTSDDEIEQSQKVQAVKGKIQKPEIKKEAVERSAKKAKAANGAAVPAGAGAGKAVLKATEGEKDKAAGTKRKQDDRESDEKSEDDGNSSLDKFRITEATKGKLIASGITSLFPVRPLPRETFSKRNLLMN